MPFEARRRAARISSTAEGESALDVIPQPGLAFCSRAMGTAKNAVPFFHVVADDPATAMRTLRSQRMDGAFKAVKDMLFPFEHYFERFVVVVSANFALSHINGSGAASVMGLKKANKLISRFSCSCSCS